MTHIENSDKAETIVASAATVVDGDTEKARQIITNMATAFVRVVEQNVSGQMSIQLPAK